MRALAKVIDNGHLVRGVKPVYWCFDCGSALAVAEIEYQDKVSPAVDVAYAARDAKAMARLFGVDLPDDAEVAVPIWTTTPWTLPASLRSEEHTSELQSLMRISYAVFCLKKKNTKNQHTLEQHVQA